MSYLWYIACEIWPAYFCQTTAYKLGKRNKKVFSITNHLHVFHFNRALRFYGWIAEVIYRKIIAFALNISSQSNDKNICLMIKHKSFEFLGSSLSMIRIKRIENQSDLYITYLMLNKNLSYDFVQDCESGIHVVLWMRVVSCFRDISLTL